VPRKPTLRLVTPVEETATEFPGNLRKPKQYKGASALGDTTGEYLVTFDAGSFRFIAEQLQSLVHRQASELNPVGMPAAKGAAIRALHAVRATAEALGITQANPEPETVPARRGRPPKVSNVPVARSLEHPYPPVPAEVVTPEPKVDNGPGPKRRGRPPKVAVVPAEPARKPRVARGAKPAPKPATGRTGALADKSPGRDLPVCKHPARTSKGCTVCDFNARK
jgi:hypothetical protein